MDHVKGTVHLELYDAEGNLIQTIDRHNTDTLWAKFHTPTTLYLDLILQSYEELLGVPDISSINKTVFNQAAVLRSGLVNQQFSQSGNSYTSSFTWTNSTFHNYKLYGLLSFSGDNVYTIFDMSEQPVDVPPNTVVSGQYVITYNQPTPVLPPDEQVTDKTITANSLIVLSDTEPSPDMREYKYSRSFVKTSEYMGVDTSDTNINSSINVAIHGSTVDKRALDHTHTGEVFYKFLESGNPGGAKAVRYFRYYNAIHHSGLVVGNLNYKIQSLKDIRMTADYKSAQVVDYVNARSIWLNRSAPSEVRPWKFHFPNNIQKFSSNTVWDTGRNLYIQKYIGMNPRVVYTADRVAFAQDIMYLYWPDNPTFTVYLYSFSSNINARLYVNGQEYVATITNLGNNNWKLEFDLSGLSSGEGIVVLNIEDFHSVLVDTAHLDNTVVRTTTVKLIYETNMYGYVVPYVGFLEDGSSEITGNYISAGLCSVDGQVTDMTMKVDSSTVSRLDLVSGVRLDEVVKYTDYQYFVWVTESEYNKLAGILNSKQEAKLQVFMSRFASNSHYYTAESVLCPVYVGAGNYITFRHLYTSVYQPDVVDLLGTEGLLSDTYTMVENNHVESNHSNREVNFYDDYAFSVLADSTKSYLCRKQGLDTYNILMPESLSDYSEGSTTVTHQGSIYEFETTITTNEQLGNLSVNFTSSSIFALHEYLSFPVVDSFGLMVTDALETWKQTELYKLPGSDTTLVDNQDNIGTDEIFECTTCSDPRSVVTNMRYKADLVLDKIKPTIGIEGSRNFYFTVNVPIAKDVSVKRIVLVPKRFEYAGNTYYVNVESIVVTDGLRIIPWYLDNYGSSPKVSDISQDIVSEYWVLILNSWTLKSIADVDISEGALLFHVYFEAKTIDEILPIDIDFSCGFVGPDLSVLNRKVLAIEPDKSQGTILAADCDVSRYGLTFDTNNITIDDDNNILFDPDQQSYIKLSESDTQRLSVLTSNSVRTLEFSFSYDTLPDDKYVLLHDLRQRLFSDKGYIYGFMIHLDQAGQLVFTYWAQRGYFSSDTWRTSGVSHVVSGVLDPNVYHYVVVQYTGKGVEVYVDGNLTFRSIDEWVISYQGAGAFRIGSTTTSENFFKGKLRYLRVLDGRLWYSEHSPMFEPYTVSDNIPRRVYEAGETQIRVNLPYAIDHSIDVIDESGNHVDFCHLKTGNVKVEEGDCGEILFISGPQVDWSYSNVVKSSMHTVPFSIASTAFNYLQQSTTNSTQVISNYQPTLATNTANPYFTRHISNVVKPLDEYWDFYAIPDLSDTVSYIYHDVHKQYKIIQSAESAASDPKDLLPVYGVGEDVLDAAVIRYNWDNEQRATKYLFLNPSQDSKGLLFDLVRLSNLEVVVATPEASETDVKLYSTYAVAVSATQGDSAVMKNFGFAMEVLESDPRIYNGYSPATSSWYYHVSTIGKYLLVYNNINLSSVIGWKEPANSLWTHRSVNVAPLPVLSGFVQTTYSVMCPQLTQIEPITTTDGKLYHLDGLFTTLQYGAFKIEDVDLINHDFSVRTYVVTSFDTYFPVYKNFFGTHILSDPTDSLEFSIVAGHVSVHAQSDFSYILTKDEEFVNLLKSNLLHLPYTEVAYVDNSFSNYVPKGTPVINTETDTVVIWKHAVHRLTKYTSVYSTAHPQRPSISQAVYLDGVDVQEKLLVNRPHIYDNYLFNMVFNGVTPDRELDWVRAFGRDDVSWSDLEFIQPSVFRRAPDEWHVAKLKEDYWLKVTVPRPLLHMYNVDKVDTRVLRNTQLDSDAALTDIVLAPIANRTGNILFDPKKLPANKVKDFGNFSIVGSASVDDRVYVVPILKLTNTNTGEIKYFALNREYAQPECVDYYIPQILENSSIRHRFLQYYLSNLYSYKPFNALLNDYNTNQYQFQYGLVVIPASMTDDIVVVKSLVVQPELTDKSLYDEVPFCYVVGDELHGQPETARNIVQSTNRVFFKNTSNQPLSNVIVRVDLSEIDVSQFTNGISGYVNNTHVPTVYEKDPKTGQLTTDFSAADKQCIYVKFPNVPANSIVELELRDEVIGDTITAVFADYVDFSEDLTAIDTIVLPDQQPVSVVDTNSTTERAGVCVPQPVLTIKGSALVINSIKPVLFGLNRAFDSTYVYEVGYSADDDIIFDLLLSPDTPQLKTVTVPSCHYYDVVDISNSTISVHDSDSGTGNTSYTERYSFGCEVDNILVAVDHFEADVVKGINIYDISYTESNEDCVFFFAPTLDSSNAVSYFYKPSGGSLSISDSKLVLSVYAPLLSNITGTWNTCLLTPFASDKRLVCYFQQIRDSNWNSLTIGDIKLASSDAVSVLSNAGDFYLSSTHYIRSSSELESFSVPPSTTATLTLSKPQVSVDVGSIYQVTAGKVLDVRTVSGSQSITLKSGDPINPNATLVTYEPDLQNYLKLNLSNIDGNQYITTSDVVTVDIVAEAMTSDDYFTYFKVDLHPGDNIGYIYFNGDTVPDFAYSVFTLDPQQINDAWAFSRWFYTPVPSHRNVPSKLALKHHLSFVMTHFVSVFEYYSVDSNGKSAGFSGDLSLYIGAATKLSQISLHGLTYSNWYTLHSIEYPAVELAFYKTYTYSSPAVYYNYILLLGQFTIASFNTHQFTPVSDSLLYYVPSIYWKENINLVNSAIRPLADVESGSWTINGATFTKRRKLLIQADRRAIQSSKPWLRIPQWLHDMNSNCVVTLESYQSNELGVVSAKSPTLLQLFTDGTSVYSEFEPLEYSYSQWFNKRLRTSSPFTVPTNSKILFYARTGGYEARLYFIRAKYNTLDEYLKQLSKSDIGILVDNVATNWYFFDFSATQQPDLSSINSSIDRYRNKFLTVIEKDWISLVDLSRISNSTFATGRTLKYVLHDR